MGVNVLVALLANGVGFGSAMTAVYGVFGAAALRIGGSLLLSAAASAITRGRVDSGQQTARALALPAALPVVRHVYGRTRAVGSPANFPVREDRAMGFWLLNSRPSALTDPVVFLDKREITFTGDPFDFAGPGAVADSAPFTGGAFRFWIGRGDQLGPPADLVTRWPKASGRDSELLQSSDAMRGCTVLWAEMLAGDNTSLQSRWVAMPPTLEVEGDWSLVWDPRDGDQAPGDPASWAFSRNHALCVLDALRRNPMRRYPLGNLMIDTFAEGADVCDEPVALKAGGTEPRWSCDGTLSFAEGELERLINPMVVSGAADLIRAGGRLGYAWGKYRPPVVTLTALVGDGIEVEDLTPGDQMVNTLRVTYRAPARGYDTADLRPWPIPGALAEDGGIEQVGNLELPFAGPTQAMRARKRHGLRLRRQRKLTGTLPPAAFNLLPGAGLTLELPAPFDALDGIYEVVALDPYASPLGADGQVALRLPATLIIADPGEDDWTPATDEEDLIVEPYDGTRSGDPVPLADLVEPAGLGRTRYVTGWRGGDAYVSGDGYWWRDTISGAIVTAARSVADFGLGQYQIDSRGKSRAKVITLTRASTATYVDSDGVLQTAAIDAPRIDYRDGIAALLVEPAGGNAWTWSEDLANAVWTKTRASISANAAAAPDGALTADKLVEDTATNTHYLRRARSFVSGVPVTVALFGKAAGRDQLRINLSAVGMATQNFYIDLLDGSVTTASGTTFVEVFALADGWWWILCTFTPNATVVGDVDVFLRNRAAGSSYAGDGTSGVYLWGLQDGAGSYCPTAGATATRAADVPGMAGLTATLDLDWLYGDDTAGSAAAVAVTPGYWPTLTQTRIRRLIGRTP